MTAAKKTATDNTESQQEEKKPFLIPDFEKRVEDKLGIFEPFFDELPTGKMLMIRDSLYDYCRIGVMLDDITDKVLREGYTVVNNRGRVERNPDIMTMHQWANEKVSLFSKIYKALPSDEKQYVDELTEFARL